MGDTESWIGIAGVLVAFLTLFYNRLDRRRTAQKEAEAAAKIALNGMEARIMVAVRKEIEDLRDNTRRTFSERDERHKEEREANRETLRRIEGKIDALFERFLDGVRPYDPPRR